MIQNTSGQSVYFEARSLKDGTLVSGLSVSASLSLDGAAPVSSTNTVSEIGTTGRYQLALSQSETNHYTLAVLLTTATADVFLPLIQADFTPVPDIPTVAQIQSGLAKTSELPDVSGLAAAADIPTVSQIQSGLAKTSELPDVSGLATLQNLTDSQTAIVSACATASGFATPADVPTVAQIWAGEVARNSSDKIVSAKSVLSSLYTADPATFAKEASLSALPTAQSVAAYVWSVSSRTLTGAALAGSDSLATTQTITPLSSSMTEIQNTVSSVYASVLNIPTVTYTVPTVSQIQEGLAKTSELPDVSGLATAQAAAEIQAAVGLIPTQTYTVPTVAEIQEGLAKTSELPDVSTLATASSVAAVKAAVDEIPTQTYTVPTVTEIQTGLATSAELASLQTHGDSAWAGSTPAEIASAVWMNGARTLTASPTDVSTLATAQSVQEVKAIVSSIPTVTYNVPTVSQIQDGLASALSITALQTSINAIPTATYNVPTAAEIQEGLAKTSELPDVSGLATAQAAEEIQAAVGLIPTVTYTVPTAAEIASAVIAKDFSGETFPLHSLAGGVCAHLHFAVGEESITVYGPDGETVLGRIPYTSAASAEPITGLGVSNE